jgi:hypothetical protein
MLRCFQYSKFKYLYVPLLVISLIMNNALCLWCDYYRNNNYLQQIQKAISEVNAFADNKSVSQAVPPKRANNHSILIQTIGLRRVRLKNSPSSKLQYPIYCGTVRTKLVFLARCSPTHIVSDLFCCLSADICSLTVTAHIPRAIRAMAYIERDRRTDRYKCFI